MFASTGVRVGAVALLIGTAAASASGGRAAAQAAPPTPESAQRALVERLAGRTGGDLTVDRDDVTGAVTFVGTETGQPIVSAQESDGDPEAAAAGFVGEFGPLFGAVSTGDLELQSVDPRVDGGATAVYHQVVDGVPVVGGELRVQVDDQGDVLSALGELAPAADVEVTPTVDAGTAADEAVIAVAKAYGVGAATLSPSDPEQWVYAPDLLGGPSIGGPRLVWRLEVTGPGEDEPLRELVLIDATTGTVALHFNQIADALSRKVCNFANVRQPVPDCVAAFARVEGQGATGDGDVDQAYEYSGDTYNFFSSRFGRDSLDDNGLPLLSTVRYCPPTGSCPYPNAFWNGEQMTYGEGYASADDVVGHELTHGVTEFSNGLFYYFQSGAINESISDVFGELVDLSNGAGDDSAGVRWLMGEDLTIGALRDMADPPAFGDPDRMTSANYTLGLNDAGGVHTNSGVNNKAAALMVDGGTFNSHTVAALGLTKTARIYYETITTMLGSASDYADLGRALPQACTNVIGTDGITAPDCAAVQQAVDAVEMSTDPPNAPAPEAPECAAEAAVTAVFSDDLENPGLGRWAVTGTGAGPWAYPQNPNPFNFDATYATSGTTNFFAADVPTTTNTQIARTASVTLPANSILLFNHAYEYEAGFDGGVVEYSTNGGTTWTGAGPLFTHGGYNGTIAGGAVPAFTNLSNGYRSSRINLASLAGQNFRFRFRSTTDSSVGWFGWFIDDIRILSCVDDVTDPTVDLRTPPSGAAYAHNQAVTADYSCADEFGGSGIDTCIGTVLDGQPIDTSTLGDHDVVVTAVDNAGNETPVTHAYTVVPDVARSDARIKRGASGLLVGNNVYNATGLNQTRTGSAARGRSVTYYVSVQNDAAFTEPLRLRGQGSTSRFTVVYRNPAGTNITNQVTTGAYTTPNLAPQATHQIKVVVTVRPTAPLASSAARTLTAISTVDDTIRDTVKFVTRRS